MTSEPDKEKTRVLIVDDDKKLCRLVTDYLEPMGYLVESAYTGSDGLKEALSRRFDVVILDVMLPELDGFEFLRRLRQESDIPVLMLTSRGDETDRIVGLEMGADDYLPKTFSTRELLARLRAVTRRAFRPLPGGGPPADSPLNIGALRIEPDSRTARLDGGLLELTPIEYELLICLARAAGRVLSRDHLLEMVSGREFEVFDRSIDVHISSLRRKLGDNPKKPRFIKTVRRAGYMFLTDHLERV